MIVVAVSVLLGVLAGAAAWSLAADIPAGWRRARELVRELRKW